MAGQMEGFTEAHLGLEKLVSLVGRGICLPEACAGGRHTLEMTSFLSANVGACSSMGGCTPTLPFSRMPQIKTEQLYMHFISWEA
jgi:hypothetical protein